MNKFFKKYSWNNIGQSCELWISMFTLISMFILTLNWYVFVAEDINIKLFSFCLSLICTNKVYKHYN